MAEPTVLEVLLERIDAVLAEHAELVAESVRLQGALEAWR